MEDFLNSLNPSISGSLAVVQEMVRQVMKRHKRAKYFHIGCHEVSWDRAYKILTKQQANGLIQMPFGMDALKSLVHLIWSWSRL